eukprot:snap_masked-scaffold934_size79169-processed-gene-0.6 protein:Tk02400 transcript:snap_masked-scaffold934_size79169-processed-gene-0.6-mRNA-1 annotation:"solute carrier family 12 member 9"
MEEVTSSSSKIILGGDGGRGGAANPGSSYVSGNDQVPLVNSSFDDNGEDDFQENREMDHLTSNDGNPLRTLGSFQGVFCPVSLSMFSTLLFLRIGYIVGNAGLVLTLGSVAMAYGILCITVLSISAIASNGAVEAGGVYFMISRTLGAEVGGGVGVLFFSANVFASALYATGCVEGILSNFGKLGFFLQVFPSGEWIDYGYCSALTVFNLMICLVGPKLFGRTSMAVLTVVVFCAVAVACSFCANVEVELQFNRSSCHDHNCSYEVVNASFHGLATGISMWSENWYPDFRQDCESPKSEVTFSTVFAVLFSGVTGIMAGANMSGDLHNPGRSIPYGTLWGCTFTGIMYLIIFTLTALTCSRELLYNDCQYMTEVVFWPPLVAIGTILTTFCASTSSLIGASRVLYALARDNILGPISPWVKTVTGSGNPYAAVVITFLCVQIVLLLGSLNQIAKLCSLLFLLSYLSVNLACLGLEWAKPPSFRPSFAYFHLSTCLLGAVLSGAMMFILSKQYTLMCFAALIVIFVALHYARSNQKDWGSLSQGIIFHTVRKYLLLLHPDKNHVKYWRPNILLLVGNARKSCALMDFTNALKKSGMYFLGHVSVAKMDELLVDPVKKNLSKYQKLIDHLKIKAFIELTIGESLRHGIQNLICLAGLGVMKPNTIMLGFPRRDDAEMDELTESEFASPNLDKLFPDLESEERLASPTATEFLSILGDIIKLEKNLVVHRHFQKLNHTSLFARNRLGMVTRPSSPVYLDVWLVDFFSAPNSNLATTCNTFVLTLANLVTRVARWKHLTMRVLIRGPLNDADGATEALTAKLGSLLANMRIVSQRLALDLDADCVHEGVTMPPTLRPHKAPYNILTISDEYMRTMNRRVLHESLQTAVSIVALARPPYRKRSHELDEKYIRLLDILTENLPPTLLIYGVDNVIA